MKALFADSFYFIALLRLEDSAHARALAAAQNRTERLITTAWILTEVADALAVPAMREGFPRQSNCKARSCMYNWRGAIFPNRF